MKPIPAPQHTYMSERKRKDRFMRLLVTQLTVLSTVYCLMVSHKGDADYRICTASDYLLKLCKAFFFSSFTTDSDYTHEMQHQSPVTPV